MGAGGARNLGVEQAAGDIVVFVDADVVVAPDALQPMYDDLQRERLRLPTAGHIYFSLFPRARSA
ncbi:MAG: glycosyltransferase [Acidobacteriia bacterium]|nr:glycosyltransferase [Terriglobia bacterium]